MRIRSADPQAVMRAMWRRLADPALWPLYRIGFALRVLATVPAADQDEQRAEWVAALRPLVDALGVARGNDEALLWVATCRGLLWELVTGADPAAVNRAANRFFAYYRGAL